MYTKIYTYMYIYTYVYIYIYIYMYTYNTKPKPWTLNPKPVRPPRGLLPIRLFGQLAPSWPTFGSLDSNQAIRTFRFARGLSLS